VQHVGAAVFGNPGYARDVAGLNDHLGRWPALLSWAESHGLALTGQPEDLQLLDEVIGVQPHDVAVSALAGEVGLFLGTVIINGAAGARWRVWPNGHPVIVTAAGRELDVVALANDRFGTDRLGLGLGLGLADIYADAAGAGDS